MNERKTVSGKTIRLYLVDGEPTGLLTAEIINWTGKVVVAPRAKLAELARRPEVKRTGLYLLSGADPDSPVKERVYVGESDNVLTRLLQHEKDERKDYWTRALVIISKDENLTKSHVAYLERRLICLIADAGRAVLDNATAPEPPSLPEGDVADMEYFLAQVRMMLPVLGFPFAQPKPKAEEGAESPLFRMEGVGARATAREIGDEFVVFKGSTARKGGAPAWNVYRALRDGLVDEGKLRQSNEEESLLVFAEDVPFRSPSAAACVVYANSVSGPVNWKVKETGQTYKEWRQAQLEEAGSEDSSEE